MILEIRIFSNCPRNSFALGGNLHAGKRVRPFSSQQAWVPVDRRRAITQSGSCPNSARHIPARSRSVWHFPRASARSMSRRFRGGCGRVVCCRIGAGRHPCPAVGPRATCGAYVVRPAGRSRRKGGLRRPALPSFGDGLVIGPLREGHHLDAGEHAVLDLDRGDVAGLIGVDEENPAPIPEVSCLLFHRS